MAMTRSARWDAPFWVGVVVVLVAVGSLGFFGVAFVQARTQARAEILNTNDYTPPADLAL
jgi:hypothetical protein